jgi:hypothetical protein
VKRGIIPGLLVAALASGAAVTAPTTTVTPFGVQAAPTATMSESAPAQQAGATLNAPAALMRYSRRVYSARGVWHGVAKRGNRRGRSRWNYNR